MVEICKFINRYTNHGKVLVVHNLDAMDLDMNINRHEELTVYCVSIHEEIYNNINVIMNYTKKTQFWCSNLHLHYYLKTKALVV